MFFSIFLSVQHVDASEFKEGFVRIASSSTELDDLHANSHVFSPVVAASVMTPTIDTSFVEYSPEGVSLYPFSPSALKQAAVLKLKEENKQKDIKINNTHICANLMTNNQELIKLKYGEPTSIVKTKK